MTKLIFDSKLIFLFINDLFLISCLFFLLLLLLHLILDKNKNEQKNILLMLKYGFYTFSSYLFCYYNLYKNQAFIKWIDWSENINPNSFGNYIDLYLINKSIYFLKIIIVVLFLLVYFIGFVFFKYQKKLEIEYIYFLIFFPFPLLLLLNGTDLLYIYIVIELFSLNVYILLVSNKYSNYSSESSLKYFILSSLSSCFFLFGVALYYCMLGTTDSYGFNILLLNLSLLNEYSYGIYLACIFLSFGFLFKLGVFPFHVWVPDVYQGTSLFFMMILTTLPKLAILIVFCKLNGFVFANFRFITNNIWFICALFSLFIGVFGSFYQTNLKRLWAYSAISHMGFLFCNFLNFTNISIFGSILYFLIYILMSFNFFFILISSAKYRTFLYLENIREVVLLSNSYRFWAYMLAILLFSFIGIPPLAGFFTKLIILENLSNSSEYIMIFLVIFFTSLSSFYYLRLIRKKFFKRELKSFLMTKRNKLEIILLLNLNGFNLLFFLLVPLFIYYLENFISNMI